MVVSPKAAVRAEVRVAARVAARVVDKVVAKVEARAEVKAVVREWDEADRADRGLDPAVIAFARPAGQPSLTSRESPAWT